MTFSPLVSGAARLWGATPRRVIDEHARHAVFIAKTHEERPVFIKATSNKAQAVQLKNEAKANLFMSGMLDPKRFKVPDPLGDVRTDGEIHAIAFEFLEADWFATKFPRMHLLREVTNEELIDIVDLMYALHRREEVGVPKYFIDRAVREFSDEHILEKQMEYLLPVVNAGHVSHEDFGRLQAIVSVDLYDDDHHLPRRFVHHDIVPWNLGRDHQDRLVLVDAEFSRWGMAYYDIAYWFLQCRIMLNDPELARRGLRQMMGRFGCKGTADDDLWRAMAYRFSANLNVAALEQPAQLPHALALLPYIVNCDIDGLLKA